MNLKRSILAIFIILQVISTQALARWQTHSDASIEFENFSRNIKAKADGSSTETIEIQARILKDGGKDLWAHYPIVYNSDTSSITILEAKTIHDGKEYHLDKNLIEDKPLASSPQGFDQKNQVSLAYPNVAVGAKLYLKYKMDIKTSPLPNFYSTDFVYGENFYFAKSKVTLESELPLHIAINDPYNAIKITKNKADNFKKLTLEQTKPIYNNITEEGYLLDHKKLTWITVSSMNNWQEFAKQIGTPYAKVLQQKLPEEFVAIANSVKTAEGDDIAMLNAVTATLADKVQYMGDWRTVAGKFAPHDLAHIAKTKLGDCKDFTVAAGAILQELGFKVQPTLVLRGQTAYGPPNKLPGFNHANHVFLKVTNKQNTVYWIDPTNFVSMAQNIFPDIANKDVLVIDPKQPGWDKTPAINPATMQIKLLQEWDLQKPKIINSKGHILLQGQSAMDLTGAYLLASKEAIDNAIFSFVGNEFKDATKEIYSPDLTSRIVKDLEFKFSYSQENNLLKTNLGHGVNVPGNKWVISSFIDTKPDQVSDVYLGSPRTQTIETRIHNFPVTLKNNLDLQISSKWLDVTRKITVEAKTIAIINQVTIKQSFIPNDELRSAEYLKLKNTLQNEFDNVALISF